MIWQQSVVTTLKHSGREMTHKRLGLHVEVSEHLIGLPSSQQANPIRVDVGAKEGHGAGSA